MLDTTPPTLEEPPAPETSTSIGESRPRRIPQLDGLRAVAFGSVFLFHSFPQMPNKIALWAGVDLFFILSGFLITGILMRSQKRPRTSYFGDFYYKRARRILPPYTLAALFGAALFSVNLTHEWPWYVFFASNVAQSFGNGIVPPMTTYWSLAVEEQFYLLWPIVVAFCSVKTVWRIALAGLVVVPVLRVVFSPWLSVSGGIYLLTPFRADLLLTGAFLAIIWRRHEMLPPIWKRISVPLMAASLAIYTALCFVPNFQKDSGSMLFDGAGYALILLFCAALLTRVLTLEPGSWFYRILMFAPVAYLGRISYMMYLLHSTCIMFCLKYLNGYSHLLSRLAALAGTILLSAASWHLIEKRLLNRPARAGWLSNARPLSQRV